MEWRSASGVLSDCRIPINLMKFFIRLPCNQLCSMVRNVGQLRINISIKSSLNKQHIPFQQQIQVLFVHHHVHDHEQKVPETNTNKSNRDRMHEINIENTLCKTPSTRPPKQCPNQQRLQKICRFLNVFKSAGILFPPNQPHQTSCNHILDRRRV